MFLPKMHELNLFMRKQENSNWEIYYTMTVLCTSKIPRSKKKKELRQWSRLKETKCSLKFGSIIWTIEIGGLCRWLRIYLSIYHLSIYLSIYLFIYPSIHLSTHRYIVLLRQFTYNRVQNLKCTARWIFLCVCIYVLRIHIKL